MFDACVKNVKTQLRWERWEWGFNYGRHWLTFEHQRVDFPASSVMVFTPLHSRSRGDRRKGYFFSSHTHKILHVISVLPSLAYPLRGKDGCAHAHRQLKGKRERNKVNSMWRQDTFTKPCWLHYACEANE